MRSVHMLVGNFFFAALAHVDHLDGKAQNLACQRVLAVQHHGVTVNFTILNGDICVLNGH